jgi:hypothetical protein
MATDTALPVDRGGGGSGGGGGGGGGGGDSVGAGLGLLPPPPAYDSPHIMHNGYDAVIQVPK